MLQGSLTQRKGWRQEERKKEGNERKGERKKRREFEILQMTRF